MLDKRINHTEYLLTLRDTHHFGHISISAYQLSYHRSPDQSRPVTLHIDSVVLPEVHVHSRHRHGLHKKLVVRSVQGLRVCVFSCPSGYVHASSYLAGSTSSRPQGCRRIGPGHWFVASRSSQRNTWRRSTSCLSAWKRSEHHDDIHRSISLCCICL